MHPRLAVHARRPRRLGFADAGHDAVAAGDGGLGAERRPQAVGRLRGDARRGAAAAVRRRARSVAGVDLRAALRPGLARPVALRRRRLAGQPGRAAPGRRRSIGGCPPASSCTCRACGAAAATASPTSACRAPTSTRSTRSRAAATESYDSGEVRLRQSFGPEYRLAGRLHAIVDALERGARQHARQLLRRRRQHAARCRGTRRTAS